VKPTPLSFCHSSICAAGERSLIVADNHHRLAALGDEPVQFASDTRSRERTNDMHSRVQLSTMERMRRPRPSPSWSETKSRPHHSFGWPSRVDLPIRTISDLIYGIRQLYCSHLVRGISEMGTVVSAQSYMRLQDRVNAPAEHSPLSVGLLTHTWRPTDPGPHYLREVHVRGTPEDAAIYRRM
jgi:hypothetical protein